MADPDDDLDNLVSELNLTATPATIRLTADLSPNVETWLGRVRELDGSDLLLVAGAPPMIRAAGRMVRASDEILDGDDIERAVVPLAGPACCNDIATAAAWTSRSSCRRWAGSE